MSASKGDEDPTWSLLLICILIWAAGWAIWHFFQDEILFVLRYLRVAEAGVMGLFNDRAKACMHWMWNAKSGASNMPSPVAIEYALSCYGPELRNLPTVEALKYYNFTVDSFVAMTRLVAPPFRWILGIAASGIALYTMYLSPLNWYKASHTLESFIKVQAKMWPVISPIVNFIPSSSSARIPGETVPDKLPLFAEALSPEEWVAWCRIPIVNGVPDKERARQAYIRQLGPRWNGTAGLPIHVICLLAAFALQGVQKRDKAEALLSEIAQDWTPEKGFLPKAELVAKCRKLMEDPAVGGKAMAITGRHAWRVTALLGALKWARRAGGVLAPAQFLWLRGAERNLWYPLNNLGRRAFHAEGAGAMAHFMAEEAAQKPLVIPRMETAIATLNTYFAKGDVKVPEREEPAIQGRARRVKA
jgi:hypothetical protein